MLLNLIKVLTPAVLSFVIGIGVTPILTHYLYAHRMWKKKAGKRDLGGKETPLFNQLHETREVGTPRLGGMVIWSATALTVFGIFVVAQMFPLAFVAKLDFLTRSQTWLPLAALLVGAFVGLYDDVLQIIGGKGAVEGGLALRTRLAVVVVLGLFAGWWFFEKLDVVSVGVPFLGEFFVGWLLIPLFSLVMLAVYSGGIIDGIDGLAGGIFAIIFGAYGAIAFFQNQINLAAFCAALLGGILAFLWFNIPPARFYMSETGSMALTLALTVVAFMTDALGEGNGLLVLPLIALPLVATTLSAIVQLCAKKFWGRKVFRIAPLHHHLEAIGWPPHKITMRYWVIGVISALAGVIVALVS
jgi:phospho-N-acetylmuramoyl-pentapeptide-transferase